MLQGDVLNLICYTVTMVYLPYTWYQLTFKPLTKGHFVVVTVGMGLSGMQMTDLSTFCVHQLQSHK